MALDGVGKSAAVRTAEQQPKVENKPQPQPQPQPTEDGMAKKGALQATGETVRTALNNRVIECRSAMTPETGTQAVKEAFRSDGAEGAARELANQLRCGDTNSQQELMASLSKEREFPYIINAAGGESDHPSGSVTAADRQTIAAAFGSAYDAGKLDAETITSLTAHNADPMHNLLPKSGAFKSEYTANFLLNTGSKAALRDFAYQTLQNSQDPTRSNPSAIRGAARAAAGDPQLLQDVLRDMGAGKFGDGLTVDSFVDSISRNPPPGIEPFAADRTSALVRVLDTAAQMPFGDEKLALFTAAAKSADATRETTGGADALVRLFNSDAQQISDHFLNETAPQRNDRLKDFSTFFQNTLFNSQTTNKQELVDNVTGVANDYKRTGDLYHLGALAGSVENGFSAAVKDNADRKEATKSFLDFVVGLTPLPDSIQGVFKNVLGELPQAVADGLASTASDSAKGAALDWLTDQLTKENKILFWKTGQEIENRNDLDDILRQTLGVPQLTDPVPATPRDNEAVQTFEAGLSFARQTVDE